MIVEHYTAERGLPNNIVNCTLKGQDGFIWFGTQYGLCSFDGSKFRSYDNHDGFYSTDIPPRKIQRIVEDKNGFPVSYTHLDVYKRQIPNRPFLMQLQLNKE